MNKVMRLISLILILTTLSIYPVYADNKLENDSSEGEKQQTEVNIDESNVTKVIDKLETLLDPENNELEHEVNKTLEKHSDNWFVKFFKTIIDAISSFLDAIFKLASEAAKIEVD